MKPLPITQKKDMSTYYLIADITPERATVRALYEGADLAAVDALHPEEDLLPSDTDHRIVELSRTAKVGDRIWLSSIIDSEA